MWIENVSVENYRLFEKKSFSFHPQFNLIVGENGSGKSSLINLLAICVSAWVDDICTPFRTELLKFNKADLRTTVINNNGELRYEYAFRARIEAVSSGIPTGDGTQGASKWVAPFEYIGEKGSVDSKTSEYTGPTFHRLQMSHIDFNMPLFVFYQCSRLWNPKNIGNDLYKAIEARYQRLDGYAGWANAYTDDHDLMLWIQKLDIIAYQEDSKPLGWRVLQAALQICYEDFERLGFMAKEGQVVIFFRDGRRLPFNQLSDGQRTLFAMIGDIVRRAVLLNPQLGDRVLEETPGVVLIDELDLHLHPKWQRRIIEDLRRTFPKIQFIATTHSPFLIQSLRSGEELIMLDGQPTDQLGNMSLEDIARGIMGVARPEVSERYEEMKAVARNYLETLELAAQSPEEKLEAFKQELAKSIAPYAGNPAFQAFLEMKRAAKLGE